MTIGEIIKKRRKELGLSQSQVAEASKLTYQSVLSVEKDKTCTLNSLRRICKAVGLKITITKLDL